MTRTGILLALLVAPFSPPQVIHAAKGQDQAAVLWSLQPIVRPPLPAVKNPAPLRNEIDRFIAAELGKKELQLSPEADRRVLIRRLHFILLGLPPTPERVEQFVHDHGPRAYEHVVDELLASPRFGERWARHWMDVVRYADTHGTEHDSWLPHAWRYRDYLVRAFNDGLPYDQFVREHIAGDLLPRPRWNSALGINESLAATAWWRFVEFNQTPVDVKGEEVIVIDNQIDALSKAFLGLTVSCARCHDHKFDPISQRDFHGLYSVLASTRTAMRVLDDPAKLRAKDADLARLKPEIRAAIAEIWDRQIETWPQVIAAARTGEKPRDASLAREFLRWQKAFEDAEASRKPPALLLRGLAGTIRKNDPPLSQQASNLVLYPYADFSSGADNGWFATGDFTQHAPAGEFAVALGGSNLLSAVYPAGRYSHLASDKHAGTLRSPNFTLTNKFVSVLGCGDNYARIRLVIENFQGDSLLFKNVTPNLVVRHSLRWLTLPIRENWKGRRAYLELMPRDDMPYVGIVKEASKLATGGRSAAGIRQVVFHDEKTLPEPLGLPVDLSTASDPPALAAALCKLTQTAVRAWAANRCDDLQASLLNGLLQAGVLENDLTSTNACKAAALVTRYREIEAQVPIPQRIVGVVDEAPGIDEPLFQRGNHLQPGAPVPRGFLAAFKNGAPYSSPGSGRRELAEDVIVNPLAARVMVNRLWHHVFGAGLVRTTDNFGKLGELPSHPELLDWLASEFATRGWSVKAMLRLMLNSEAFRRSSEVPQKTVELDPDNRLLSHANFPRLDAESLRDAILAVSGRLDHTMFGPSVPVSIPPGHRDDYTPVEGPLDGRGRRSLYLEVRRNHLSPFLVAFDHPKPGSPTGRREPTNVPAQGLTLLNDPFVLEQAELFSRRALAQSGNMAARIHWVYATALGRPASKDEVSRALEFLTTQTAVQDGNEAKAWRDLAHAIFNLKEFLYLR